MVGGLKPILVALMVMVAVWALLVVFHHPDVVRTGSPTPQARLAGQAAAAFPQLRGRVAGTGFEPV
jgi:multidrug resistance efflux pump